MPKTNIYHFWDMTEHVFRENIQSTEIYTNDTTLRPGFFPGNALGHGPTFWICFPDPRIWVKLIFEDLKFYKFPVLMLHCLFVS